MRPLRADPKPEASSHRYLFVVEVEKVTDDPLPSNKDTAEVIKAAIEATGLCGNDEPMKWRVSRMEAI